MCPSESPNEDFCSDASALEEDAEFGDDLEEFLEGAGPGEHEDWVEWGSGYVAGYSAEVGAIGDRAFVVWNSPEGVRAGWEEWLGTPESADEDALEYATDMAVFDGAIERDDPYGLENDAGGRQLQEGSAAVGQVETQNRADDDSSYSAFDLYRGADGRIAVTFRDETTVIGVFSDLDEVREAINPPGNLRVLFTPHVTWDCEVWIE